MRHLVVHNARLIDANTDLPQGWVEVIDGVITQCGAGEFRGQCHGEAVDAAGAILMPGVIDEHVHFREPGLTEKADMASESRAAAAGGVTTFFDMPNTKPPTTTLAAWEEKMRIAAGKSLVNYAFFIGATPDNLDFIASADYRRTPGIKLFMGSTTGSTATDSDEFLKRLFDIAPAIVAVHAEDDAIIQRNIQEFQHKGIPPTVDRHADLRSAEACYKATEKIVGIARNAGKRLHVMHLSTAAELELFRPGDIDRKLITCETCPQYLLFDRSHYATLGARIKCNPAIKEPADRQALVKAVFDGTVDTIGTDHAPHLLQQKQGDALTASSGMPGVQFALPLMMQLATDHGQSLSTVSRLMAANPGRLWRLAATKPDIYRGVLQPGAPADMVLVRRQEQVIADASVHSLCRWTPYASLKVGFTVETTWVNGQKVYDKGIFTPLSDGTAVAAEAVSFNPCNNK